MAGADYVLAVPADQTAKSKSSTSPLGTSYLPVSSGVSSEVTPGGGA